MENKMGTTIVEWGYSYIGLMEDKMETDIQGLGIRVQGYPKP